MTPDASRPSFPRQNARTQRFTLGRPRSFTVSPDGQRVAFIRSRGGDDRVGRLWVLDPSTGEERLAADPATLLGGGDEELSPEERSRRERMREAAGGIVGYAVDADVTRACFALSGRLFVTSLLDGASHELPSTGPVVDPRLDPTGRRVAYASGGGLRVTDVDGSGDRLLVGPTGDGCVVGLADFVAAEELERHRGFWWSPDGERLLVEQYDETPVSVWHVSDPTHPDQVPVEQRYPMAGGANAVLSLWLVALDGTRTEVVWDRDTFEYVSAVHWSDRGAPLVQVLERRQGRALVLAVDPVTGATAVQREQTDPCWVDAVVGVPAWDPDGHLLTVEVVGGRYALCVDGEPVTPEGLQVHSVLSVTTDGVLVAASTHPVEQHVWRWSRAGGLAQVSGDPGVHTGVEAGSTTVLVSAALDQPLPAAVVTRGSDRWTVTSLAEQPVLAPVVELVPGGPDDLRIAVVLPTGWRLGSGPLPVLLDPYGGPHGQRVIASQGAFRESQWFADQGFAVVVVDGRGTPGSPSWERAVRFDVADVVLDDQVTGLHAAAHAFPDLDLGRVAIRGWSFGGYLAAMAVLRRPDVFHAAIAGAPVTDWRLYDTGYTERYLGLPEEHPAAYDRTGLLDDAPGLSRPLMLVHGFSDDNVFVANSLQLSARLTAAGRPHTLLPLSGVTHMASQEDVAENLLLLQVDFLRRALALRG